MKQSLKRLLSLILAMCMALSLLSTSVWAADTSEEIPEQETVQTQETEGEETPAEEEEAPAEEEETPAETEEAPAETEETPAEEEETPAEEEEAPAEEEEAPAEEEEAPAEEEEAPAEEEEAPAEEEETPAESELETQSEPIYMGSIGGSAEAELTDNTDNTKTLTVKNGEFTMNQWNNFFTQNDSYNNSIVTIVFQNAKIVKQDEDKISTSMMFYKFWSLKELNLSGLNTSEVTNMESMFFYSTRLETLTLGKDFKTSNVTDMSEMFCQCEKLKSIDVSGFDTSNVTDMKNMFTGCGSLESLDLSSFDTSNVTNMGGMFASCGQLKSLDLSSFHTSEVTSMSGMFYGCSSLTSIQFGDKFTTEKVTDMSYMFAGAFRGDLGNLEPTSADGEEEPITLDLTGFNTQNVETMYRMFADCSKLKAIYVSDKWSTKAVEESKDNYSKMSIFQNCESLVGGADTSWKETHKDYIEDYVDVEYARIDGGKSAPGYLTGEVTVTFDSDGGSTVDSQKVMQGEAVSKPANPTRKGYTFQGWQLDGTDYDFSTKVTKAITLKAKWKVNEYTVKFDSDGGSAVDSQKVTEGKTVSKPADPAKEGYTFQGWQLDGKDYDFSAKVTKDITLKAVWKAEPKKEEPKAKTYTVTFNSNGGSAVKAQQVQEGKTASKPANPTRKGYIFQSWQLSGKNYSFSTKVTKDITLKAVWKAQPKKEAKPFANFRTLRLTAKRGTNSVDLTWKKYAPASGYLIYGAKCGKGSKMKLLKTIQGNKTVKWTQENLKKATYYKYKVVAYKLVNGKKKVLGTSAEAHTITHDGKTTAVEAVEVNKAAVSLKAGQTFQIEASEVKENNHKKINHHREISYESSNAKVATVGKNGKVKGVKNGTAAIFVYSETGHYKTVTVTVK